MEKAIPPRDVKRSEPSAPLLHRSFNLARAKSSSVIRTGQSTTSTTRTPLVIRERSFAQVPSVSSTPARQSPVPITTSTPQSKSVTPPATVSVSQGVRRIAPSSASISSRPTRSIAPSSLTAPTQRTASPSTVNAPSHLKKERGGVPEVGFTRRAPSAYARTGDVYTPLANRVSTTTETKDRATPTPSSVTGLRNQNVPTPVSTTPVRTPAKQPISVPSTERTRQPATPSSVRAEKPPLRAPSVVGVGERRGREAALPANVGASRMTPRVPAMLSLPEARRAELARSASIAAPALLKRQPSSVSGLGSASSWRPKPPRIPPAPLRVSDL